MRIAVRIHDLGLRTALADLLTDAGHEVRIATEGAASVDLVIRQEAGSPPVAPRPPVLSLRPSPGGAADPDPGRALERVLRGGGEAVWAPPLDPRRLLDLLGSGDSALAAARTAPDPAGYPLLESSPDPWYVLDPEARTVLWANPAARRRAGGSSAGPGHLPAAAEDALARPEGRRWIDGAEGTVCAIWWTDARRRRVLGLTLLPRASRGPDAGNLRTLAEIGRVSATLAHEIRNPLASLASAIDLLDGNLGAVERDEVARMARARLTQMKTMLDDTLRLARPFRGPPVPVDLAGVVASATAIARATPAFQGIDLRVDLPADPPAGLGYAEPLQQALLNVLLNAAEAQDARGRIVLGLAREGNLAVLRVADEGPGVAESQRERAFEPFYTTKTSGTGLGLAYVRRVAEACGGRVGFEASDRGARLRLEIPAVDGAEEA